MQKSLAVAALGLVMLTGCSVSGLTGSSKFSCKAPDGVSCTSVSGIYANAQQNNLPALQSRRQVNATPLDDYKAKTQLTVAWPGMPIRSQPRSLRVWVAPWVDEEGTLHDQSYMYLMVDPGKWMVDQSRDATVRKTLTRLRPMGQPRTAANASAASGTDQPSDGMLADARNDKTAQADAREAAVVPSGEDAK